MAYFLACILKILLNIPSQIPRLSGLQILTIVVILSSHDVLHELKRLLPLLRVHIAVQLSQLVHDLILSLVPPQYRQVYALALRSLGDRKRVLIVIHELNSLLI